MKPFSVLCLGVLAAIPTLASTASSFFNFTAGSPTCNNCNTTSGNYQFSGYSTASGVGVTPTGTPNDTVTMTAWQVPISGAGSTGDLTGAYTGYYTGYGAGICSTVEGAGCGSPVHQIDNSDGDYELMEFQFTTPVNITQITLANFGTNASTTDLSNTIFYSTSTISLGSTTLSTLESSDHEQNFNCTSATSTGCNTTGGGSVTYSDPMNSTYGHDAPTATDNVSLYNVTTLIVAAQVGQSDDYFKVQSINGLAVATPEPSTSVLFGLALVGLGLCARRRKAGLSKS